MDADRMRLPRTPSLVRDGYVTCDSVHVPDSMRTALHRLCNAGSSGLSYNSRRRGIVFDSSMFSANEWACVFPQDCVQSIETYLGKNAVLLRTEVISVPARADTQYTHRDHSLGPRVSLCAAISIDSKMEVGTLLIPGSHTDGSLLPGGEMVSSATTYLMYDTHTFHAGCGNPMPDANNNRLFVTFCSSECIKKHAGAFCRATGKTKQTQVTLRNLIAPLP